MDELRFYQRPRFLLIFPPVLIAISSYLFTPPDTHPYTLVLEIARDLALYFVLLILWLAFFAQFVLPVRTFRDRQKIFDRLLAYLTASHGPAVFVENGEVKAHSGEKLKKGRGVIWLDSASAAVTRTAAAYKQTLGPGVHFIEKNETIAATADLHIQNQTFGLSENDKPFSPKPDENADMSEHSKYNEMQNRRMRVSALTRDGIEVIPSISVTFRINTGYPKDNQPGSRFGYRTGVNEEDKENEKKDKNIIYKAIIGSGINPTNEPDALNYRVAWNELPGRLAVDIWREYLSKFTFEELFQKKTASALPTSLLQPTDDEIKQLDLPTQISDRHSNFLNSVASIIHELNIIVKRIIELLEKKDNSSKKIFKESDEKLTINPKTEEHFEVEKKTAFQVINEMVNARLKQPRVPYLNENGERTNDSPIPSKEFKLLQDRGLIVLNVSISNPQFNPAVEEQLVRRWTSNWLKNAKVESERIERARSLVETAGQEQAISEYAKSLAQEIITKKPKNLTETLKTFILRSRYEIISKDRLRRQMSSELQDIEYIIKWLDENGT